MEYEFLVTAFYLSALSYYIGTLLYMLPVPFYGVKKWAPTLMVDGIFSAILVFAYTILLALIDYLGGLVGSDWSSFYTWLGIKTGIVVTLMSILRILAASIPASNAKIVIDSLLSPMISALTYVAMTLLTITLISIVITSYGARLLALGILLHSVPFRLTRSSGAMMISIVMVFSIGLPIMPAYVELISAPIASPDLLVIDYGVAFVEVHVHDSLGNPLSYPVLKAYTLDNKSLAKYLGGVDGVVDTIDPGKGLPGSREYVLDIDIAGIHLTKTVDPVDEYVELNSTFYRLDIVFNKTIQLEPLRLLYLGDTAIQNYTGSDGYYEIIVDCPSYSIFYIILCRDDGAYVYVDGVEKEPLETTYYTWYGVEMKSYKYQLEPGQHMVSIELSYNGILEPSVNEYYYLRDAVNISVLEPLTIINPIVYLVFNLFIAPLSYIAILVSSSYALARILGGSSPRLFRALAIGGRL